ncbi:hypothetical protein [Nannocystis sp.]|uniref:hypothetical protein n=1 Tax=Nannocystis sp. TaxID=1962667 RepID=UPI0024269A00|nr:hypothetical protein [Nannocystis sp.]MBK7824329.1 hypothetical protein [Nannocystis sp.]MBK9754530.1 hypothetical protein [Nannocystis sp.]
MLRRTATVLFVLSALSLGACVFGFRGEANVEASYPLTDIDVVRIQLGPTPLTVLGDELAPGLELTGAWRSIGGTAQLAKDQALGSAIVWAVDQRFAELRAEVPLKLHGQVDFEVDEIRLPPDRDLELVTELGDVYVFAVTGNISADVGVGHVDIDGGAGGLAVRTGDGNLHLRTSGNLDAYTGNGGAQIYQTGAGGNDLVIEARHGDVEVVLRSDADLDLRLSGREIRVHTGTVSSITRGSFTREVGGGSVKVWVDAPAGDISVSLDDTP